MAQNQTQKPNVPLQNKPRLAKHKPDAEQSTKEFNPFDIIHAASAGHLWKVKRLLAKGVNINFDDGLGITPVMYAAMNNKIEICKFLVSKGADVNAQSKKGTTALMWAAGHGKIRALKFLLKHNADVRIRDNAGRTALTHAEMAGERRIVKLLKSYPLRLLFDNEQTEAFLLNFENCTSL